MTRQSNQNMCFYGLFLVCVALAASHVCFADETGLVLIRQSSGNTSCLLTYVCTTTGRGATAIAIGGTRFVFSHSRYENGSDIVESGLNGEITAGELSRSTSKQCHDSTTGTQDFCYRTVINVSLSERTSCTPLQCSTIFTENGTDIPVAFGSTTVTSSPSPPTNLSVTTQMQGEVVYSWNPATDNCSSTTSVVSTVNCGSCPETINTTDNSVTCRGVIDVQDCSVSIQTVTQCSISDSVAFPVMAAPTEVTSTMSEDNNLTGANIGGIIGGIIGFLFFSLVVISSLVIGVVIFCQIYKRRDRVKSINDGAQPSELSTHRRSPEAIQLELSQTDRSPQDEADTPLATSDLTSPIKNFNQPTDGPEAPMDGTALSPVDKKTARKSIEVTETTIKAQIVAINNGHSSPPMAMSNNHDDIVQRVLKLESNQQEQRLEFDEKLSVQRVEFDDKLDMHKKEVTQLTIKIKELEEKYEALKTEKDQERKEHKAEKEKLEGQIRDLKEKLLEAEAKVRKAEIELQRKSPSKTVNERQSNPNF